MFRVLRFPALFLIALYAPSRIARRAQQALAEPFHHRAMVRALRKAQQP